MTLHRYADGEPLFVEGAACDSVARLVEGEVRITRRHGDGEVVLGHLGVGEYCGEMAAVTDRVHQATARAVGAVTVEFIAVSDFIRHASDDSRLALRLLQRLSQRLRDLDAAYAAAAPVAGLVVPAARPIAPPREPRIPAVRLAAGSERLLNVLPGAGLALGRLPFVVGRRTSHPGDAALPAIDLVIDDTQPYRLSRRHFAIARGSGGIEVRDLGSHLGTLVNGIAIGRAFSRDAAPLQAGGNTVIAGGDGSPYVFRLVVETAEIST
jgi:CRP/FNR family cyclic AMP-dependent transcriptional regulator